MDTEGHLARCMVYIDLNRVRAGAVEHPGDWDVCGYRELQNPPQRYRILDLHALSELFETSSFSDLQRHHATWVEETLKATRPQREASWSESLAVGGQAFVERFQADSGIAAHHRVIVKGNEGYQLREPISAYNADFGREMATLSVDNAVILDKIG